MTSAKYDIIEFVNVGVMSINHRNASRDIRKFEKNGEKSAGKTGPQKSLYLAPQLNAHSFESFSFSDF